MRTYTFKVKLHYPIDKHPVVLSVVHCPLEVLFDSLKQVKQFEELYNELRKPTNKELPSMYITASDYTINDGVDYVYNDYILCQYNAILESKSLTELLTHKDYYDFIDSLLAIKCEQDELEFFTKAVKQDEV